MKHFWLFFSFVALLTAPAIANSENASIVKSKQAYFEKRYDDAIEILRKERVKEPRNPSIYFNLGLSFRAAKRYPQAIWAFEKTLKLQPNDTEAIQLIESCYLEMDEGLVWKDNVGTFHRSIFAIGSNFWAILAILTSIFAALFLVLMRRTEKPSKKKLYLTITVAIGVLFLFSLYAASETHSYENEHNYAIVIDENAAVYKSEKSDSDEPSSIQLKAGSKVRILKWNKTGRIEIEDRTGQKLFVSKGIARI